MSSSEHRFRPHVIRLGPLHKLSVHAVTLMLFVSGAAWMVFERWVRVAGELGPAPHPLQPWLLRAHGAAAMAGLILFGSLLPVHMRPAWNAGRKRVDGAVMAASQALLIVTGYGLYYFAGDGARAAAAGIHEVLGLLTPAALLWHVLRGRPPGPPQTRQ
jgi:hypothetical protein